MPSSTITVDVSSSTACSKSISVNSSYIIDSIDFYGYGAKSSSITYSYTLAISTQGSITNYPYNTYSGSARLSSSSTQYLGSVSCGLSGLSSIMVGAKNISGNRNKLYLDYVVVNYSNPSVTSYIYYYNGSSLYTSTSKTGTSGSRFTYSLASAPSKTGYTFNGWSTSSNGSSGSAAGTSQIGYYGNDYEWYATWKAQTYTISYNANGGSGAPSSQTKTHNVTLTLSPTKPTRVGYEFLGWAASPTATSATYSAGGSYTSNAAATLYAVWKAKEYSVLYNGNGGTHSITGSETWEDTTNKFTFGKEYDISLETLGDKDFKYPGYNLLGWNTSWTATEPLTTLKIEKDEQPQLYAIWGLGSNIRVYTNENWQIAIPYIYENGEWKLSISKVFNNEAWRQ